MFIVVYCFVVVFFFYVVLRLVCFCFLVVIGILGKDI